MKYLLTTSNDEPLGVVEGWCELQQRIEEVIAAYYHTPKCFQDFRVYELDEAQSVHLTLNDEEDLI